MQIDAFVLLTPVITLLLLVPFVFVGCNDLLGNQSAVHVPPPVARLSFQRALRVEFDPLPPGAQPVNAQIIRTVTVLWTVRSLGPGAAVVTPPAETKGTALEAINSREPDFELKVNDWSNVYQHAAMVGCRCEIVLEQGPTVNTKETSIQFEPGTPDRFRLVRVVKLLNGSAQDPFMVVSETVKN